MGESEGEDAAVALGVREPGAIFLYHEGRQVESRTHDDGEHRDDAHVTTPSPPPF